MDKPTSVAALRLRLDRARLLSARLRGTREADQRQLEESTELVAAAKARLALADEVSRIFEAMQTRAHSRSVGTFEQLLSAVLQDVIPNKGNICLELTSSNNSPSLDIFVKNGEDIEDVLEGNGGAVNNVVSAGLRFAALTRTKNRRLMVLDEPDCWLQPTLVPNFIRVITDVARSTQTQTLMVSHKDPAYFRGRVNLVELTKDAEGVLQATVCEPTLSAWESPSQPGLRSIRLINFRAHKDTTLPLLPGVNALIGNSDLGKSTALVASLRAVAYNTSDDTVIRHGAAEAQIIIELENERCIVWTRRRKGSPKVIYALYDGLDLVAEGKAPSRGSVPEWVTAELGISQVDDLDIQIGSQKNPIFLLDQPASRRAQLLSVGRESGHLVKVMESWGDIKRVDRETVREGEIRVSRLTHRLSVMSALDSLAPACEALVGPFAEVEEQGRRFIALERLIAQCSTTGSAVKTLSREEAVLQALPVDAPVLAEVTPLQQLMVRINSGQAVRGLELPALDAVLPELHDTEAVSRIGARIAGLAKYRALFEITLPECPEPPALSDERLLHGAWSRLVALQERVQVAARDQVTADKDFETETAALTALQAQLGGVCPLCDHEFQHEALHAHVE